MQFLVPFFDHFLKNYTLMSLELELSRNVEKISCFLKGFQIGQ